MGIFSYYINMRIDQTARQKQIAKLKERQAKVYNFDKPAEDLPKAPRKRVDRIGLEAVNDEIITEFINDSNYQVFDNGRILTRICLRGHQTQDWREKILTVQNGYFRIKYKQRNLHVHRIVYAKFTGPLNKDKVINHIDGNPSNNHISNLELVTQSENNIHRFQVLNHPPVIGFCKIDQSIADEIRRQVTEENKRACDLAKNYGLAKSTVSMILNNKIWKLGKP